MFYFYIVLFLGSCAVLGLSSSWLVSLLVKVAKYLRWREFVAAFAIMALASSLPNLLVGIDSAIHKIPQLSLGDVVGGNVVDLALTLALAVLLSRTSLPVSSRMVQASTIFTVAVAVLPLLLMLDGKLGRGDGLVLILAFIFYVFWLFSKEERFKKVYDTVETGPVSGFKSFLGNLGKLILGLSLLLLAAEGVVKSSVYFSQTLNLPLAFIGILIVGLANCCPEIYFSIASARRGENWLVLGDLLGAIIVPATLVLGIVCLICPIVISDFSLFAIARIFLVIAALVFLVVIRTGQKISKSEALLLLSVYLLFVLAEILIR